MGPTVESGMCEDEKFRWSVVGEYIEAYESALAADAEAEVDLAQFVPPVHHPDRLAILCELVRVDLEYQWEQGRQIQLEQYRDLFPGSSKAGTRTCNGLRGISPEAARR